MSSIMLFYLAMAILALAAAVLTHAVVTTRHKEDRKNHPKNG